ncbi:MAG: transposase [Bacteroidota bacterium]|nr:transposase [Bacteroidota bacterium]
MIPGSFYHVYNHANGKENLFDELKNYSFFLEKISVHILSFVNLHAYCLLPNHFHLLVSIKEIDEIKLLESFKTFQKLPNEKLQPLIEKKISKSFANLFSSYTQSFNKVYNRKGSLFMPNMKSEFIGDETGICNVIHYIHANPVHHGFVKEMRLWKYSSYNTYLSQLTTRLSKNIILDIFGGFEHFIQCHRQPVDLKCKWDI